jgi:hypothetical protein
MLYMTEPKLLDAPAATREADKAEALFPDLVRESRRPSGLLRGGGRCNKCKFVASAFLTQPIVRPGVTAVLQRVHNENLLQVAARMCRQWTVDNGELTMKDRSKGPFSIHC